MALEIKPAGACRFDLVSLGEVMLRLDPGDTRIHTTRQFKVWEGGGEYNVARGLKRCFTTEHSGPSERGPRERPGRTHGASGAAEGRREKFHG